ncbi:hypothetical protein VTH82DRAFT_3931 [Thermothelomyces myriococcoides]
MSDKDDRDRLGDMAYSLATTRTYFQRRLVLMAKDKAELLERLGMGKDLYEVYPAFRNALDSIASHFTEPGRPLIPVMHAAPGGDDATLLQRTDFTQPAIFALKVALWHLWKSWGVDPVLVLGHSVGEIAAAHVASILDLPDVCRLVIARGQLIHAVPPRGRMVSLEGSADEVTAVIRTLGIAANNTPTQTVASGDADGIERLTAHFAGQGRRTKVLDVPHAFHSHHMDSMPAVLRAVAKTMQFHPLRLPIVSSLTGEFAEAGQLEQPGPIRQPLHAAAAEVAWLPSLSPRKKAGSVIIQRTIADLHSQLCQLDRVLRTFPRLLPARGAADICLPERERFALPRQRSPEMQSDRVSSHSRGGTIADNTSTDDSVHRMQFEIAWNGPACDTETTTARSLPLALTLTLARTSLHLRQVERLEDAAKLGLDGLVTLWDSDTDVSIRRRSDGRQGGLGVSMLWREASTRSRTSSTRQPPGQASTNTAKASGDSKHCSIGPDESLSVLSQALAQFRIFVSSGTHQPPERRDAGAHELKSKLAELSAKATVVVCNMVEIDNVKSVMALYGKRRTERSSWDKETKPQSHHTLFDRKERPVCSIIHAAGAQDNGVISEMTPRRLATAFGAKLDGAWNLNQLARDMGMDEDLDIFVMLSSTFAIVSTPGHAGYAAASAFLEALAHLRRARGILATSIAYGAWEGKGITAGMIVLHTARETVAKVFGFARPDDVDVSRPLQDIGINSLTTVLVRNQLVNLTGLLPTARFVFQYRDLTVLSQFLLSELQMQMEE